MSDNNQEVPERDRLPVMQWLTYTFENEVTDVILGLSERWPDVTIRILPRSRGVEIRGVVHPDGRVQSLTIEAYSEDQEDYNQGGEVTGSAARSLPAVVTSLKEWGEIARDMGGQFLERGEDARTVVDAKRATESLRALLYGLPRGAQGTRKRGADAELMLRQVVEAYKEAVEMGDRTPRKTVAAKFDYTPEHISRLLKRARQPRNGRPPLLLPDDPPAPGGDSAEGT